MTAENLPPLIPSNSLTSIDESTASLPYSCTDTEIMCDQPSISSSSDLWEEQCELSFTNLKTVPVPGCKFALNNVSGVVKPGQILAVLGPSGCGKTTLLNAVSFRLPLKSGRICVNGEQMSKRLRRTRIGYVQQHDVFFPTLTLKQTLVYTALLRLSDTKYSYKDKIQKVEDTIEDLDLYRCQHSPVGDDVTMRGISGGEKKRLSIACELITNPSVLLIDEPTSGLDSFTATNLITTLKHYAQKTYKNVIITVHQPSSRMFKMFDSLLAMSNGQTAYFGPAAEMTTHMASLGLQIEPNYNPGDFLLEKLKYDEQKVLKAWEENNQDKPKVMIMEMMTTPTKGERMLETSKMNVNNSNKSSPSPSNRSPNRTSSWQTSFLTQVKVLTKRNVQLAVPNIFSKVNVIQTLVLAFLAGFTWFQTAKDEDNLTNLEGWMFFSSNYWMLFVLFQALWSGYPERSIIQKERRSGSYRFSSYYLANLIVQASLVIVQPIVYLIISYPLLVGGNISIFAFVAIIMSHILSSLAAESVGLFLGSTLPSHSATTTGAIFTVFCQLLGGYLSTNVSPYCKIFSLVYNGLRNMQIIELFYGSPVKCAAVSRFPSCQFQEYVDPMDIFQEEKGFIFPFWSHTAVLVGFIVVFRLMSYIALKRVL